MKLAILAAMCAALVAPGASELAEGPLPSNLDAGALKLAGAARGAGYHLTAGVREAARVLAAETASADGAGAAAESARAEDADAGAAAGPATRIVGGLASYVGEHPFFGGLVITLTTGQTSVCGSSLVTSSRVLTAAHCWHDGVSTAYSMLVVLGSVRLFAGGVRVYASSVSAHAQYSPGLPDYDIALLAIPPVATSSAVKPIAIASGSEQFAGYTAEAIGFGRTSDSSPITEAASLRDVFVRVLTAAACRAYYGDVVGAAVVCSDGAGGRGVCGGDTGGPLILYSGAGGDVLIGVTNFYASAGCGSGAPSGHVRVSYHAAWIINNA